jgi:hypothetical protein
MCTWLLKDLSAVALEAATEERETAVQAGTAHYAESLPIEYQPSAEYQDLFRAALADSAERVAHAVGVVTELCWPATRAAPRAGRLARAGTPIGILMRRWAAAVHGLDLPHYTISIVRGRGIDRVALRWLAGGTRPATSRSSTAGPARARSPANWPRPSPASRATTACTSTRRSRCSPIPAAACRCSAPATTSSSRRRA